MTVIIGMAAHGNVFVGSDRRTTYANCILDADEPKWTIGERWAVGWCGTQRVSALISATRVWDLPQGTNPMMLVNIIRSMVKEDGFKRTEAPGVEIMESGSGMFTDGITLWSVCAGWGLKRVPEKVPFAHGSGGEFAQGAAVALIPFMGAADACERGIEIASQLDNNSGGRPWTVRLTQGSEGRIFYNDGAP